MRSRWPRAHIGAILSWLRRTIVDDPKQTARLFEGLGVERVAFQPCLLFTTYASWHKSGNSKGVRMVNTQATNSGGRKIRFGVFAEQPGCNRIANDAVGQLGTIEVIMLRPVRQVENDGARRQIIDARRIFEHLRSRRQPPQGEQ